MKILTLILLFSSSLSYAQNYDDEDTSQPLTISYHQDERYFKHLIAISSTVTPSSISEGIFKSRDKQIIENNVIDLNIKSNAFFPQSSLSIDYKFLFNKRMLLGATINYSVTHYEYVLDSIIHTPKYALNYVPSETFDFRYFSLFGNYTLHYFHSNWVDVSLTAAMGMAFRDVSSEKTENPVHSREIGFVYQIDPIALRVGKKLSWNVSIGIGTLGSIRTGLSYRFN